MVHVLGGLVPRRLVRRALIELKAKHRGRVLQVRKAVRVSVRVHARDVMWTCTAQRIVFQIAMA